MKFEVSSSDGDAYIRVKTFDAVTGDMAKQLAENAINNAGQRGINRFLVDVRGTPNIASTGEQYRLGHNDMEQFGLKKDSKIAILVDVNDTSHSFIETVFLNAGYRCRIFYDEEAAVIWLTP